MQEIHTSKKESHIGLKFIKLLSYVSHADKKKFRAYVESGFAFKTEKGREETLLLFDIIQQEVISDKKYNKEEVRLINTKGINKDYMQQILQEHDPNWSVHLLDKRMHALTQHLKKYLGGAMITEDTWEQEFRFLQYLNQNRAHKLFDIQFKNVKKKLFEGNKEDDFFYRMYLLENEYTVSFTSKNQRTNDSHLEESLRWLELSFYAKKLKLLIAIFNQAKVLKTSFNINQHVDFINSCSKYLDTPFIRVYHGAYTLMSDESEASYDNYIKILNEERSNFSEGETRDLYIIALNHRNRFYQKDRSHAQLAKLFEAYLEGLSSGILLDGMNATKRYISSPNFKNIIRLGLALGKADWAKAYIKTSQELLLPEEKRVMVSFTSGLIAFEERQYMKAVDLMNTVFQDTKDYFYKMDAKIVQLKAWYKESTEGVELIHVVDSYQEALRKYIDRNRQVSDLHKKRFKHFIQAFIWMWKADSNNIDKVVKDILAEDIMVEKQWLLSEALKKQEQLK